MDTHGKVLASGEACTTSGLWVVIGDTELTKWAVAKGELMPYPNGQFAVFFLYMWQ